MRYQFIVPGTFLSRPNRFIAHVSVNGKTEVCHVKNTGRCRELLLPGAAVFLERHPDAAARGRKTAYSLIGTVKKRADGTPILINMDSQAPNQAAYEWLAGGGLAEYGAVTGLKREVVYGSSRFDLAFSLDGRPALMEVKGVTLEREGDALFPDAPTERGVRHLRELEKASAAGIACFALFVIQMKGVSRFLPNRDTHPAFADALAHASASGVTVLARDCLITEDSITVADPVPVILRPDAGT